MCFMGDKEQMDQETAAQHGTKEQTYQIQEDTNQVTGTNPQNNSMW